MSVGVVPVGSACVGVAAPFGRLSAAQLLALAQAAEAAGATELRLTPWRAVLVPSVEAGGDLLAAAARVGWIVDPDDPRLGVAACAGAPGCHRGTTPVLDHAARLAALLRPGRGGIRLHVAGCAKGCAHPGAAPIALVARDGRYDLVLDGRASDPPALRGLDLDAACRAVTRHAGAVGP